MDSIDACGFGAIVLSGWILLHGGEWEWQAALAFEGIHSSVLIPADAVKDEVSDPTFGDRCFGEFESDDHFIAGSHHNEGIVVEGDQVLDVTVSGEFATEGRPSRSESSSVVVVPMRRVCSARHLVAESSVVKFARQDR